MTLTLFGESSGGFSVGLHSLLPTNKGLFQRAIAESGSGTSFISLRNDPSFTANAYGNILNCSVTTPQMLINCLKTKSVDELVQAQTTPGVPHFEKSQFGGGPLGPVLDGDLITEIPVDAVKDTSSPVYSFFRSLDVIIGNVNAEGSLLLFGLFPLQNILHFNISKGVPTSVLCNMFAPDLVYQYYKNNYIISNAICNKYKDSRNDKQGQLIVDMYGDGFFVVPTVRGLGIHSNLTLKLKVTNSCFPKPYQASMGYRFQIGSLVQHTSLSFSTYLDLVDCRLSTTLV